MLDGRSNKDIGQHLGLFADTVKKYRAQVMTKMQVETLTELLNLWEGVTPPSKHELFKENQTVEPTAKYWSILHRFCNTPKQDLATL